VVSRRLLAITAVATLLLAGCSRAAANGPDWTPQPSFPGDGGGSVVPAEPGPPLSSAPAPRSSSPSTATPSPAVDPSVVATNLAAPVGLAMLPDGTALVGERTTGRILRVQPIPGQPVQTVRTLSGLDTSGDGGLLDLALSPSYSEDQLVFAYITTPTDNRVVDFTLTGPVTPVLTGIPRGATGNTGRIAFGADGDLYVGTGDAGVAANVANPHSLAGKLLRVNSIGRPATGNPSAASPIFVAGLPEVDGLCVDPVSGLIVSTRATPAGAADQVGQVGKSGVRALRAPPASSRGIGGCAIGSGVLYVASRDGRDLLAAAFGASGTVASLGAWSASLMNRYGRLRSVVAAPDGALWLTTSNRDGHGTPISTDERVLRVLPPSGTSTSPV
jgi:glucose/arabinose dehydrogenase